MRKLVTIRKICNIRPIDGADKIEVATVDNWDVVVKKGDHKIDELVVYFEIDSFLPVDNPNFEFLKKSCYRKLSDDTEGLRIRTIKLRGQLSQGLIMPLSILNSNENPHSGIWEVGDDVTEYLKVIKFDPPLPAELNGEAVGNFPSFIPKSDEERIQNLTNNYDEYKKYKYFASEKADGTSSTFFLNNDEFGVCSRNYQLVINYDNTFGRIIKNIDIERKLRELNRNLAIQGEIVGEGIQGNKYKLRGQKLLVYNIFDIDKFEYLSKYDMVMLCDRLGFEMVPIIYNEFTLPESINDLLKIATDISKINSNIDMTREGLVWVSLDSPKRISFKTISNKFLIEYGE